MFKSCIYSKISISRSANHSSTVCVSISCSVVLVSLQRDAKEDGFSGGYCVALFDAGTERIPGIDLVVFPTSLSQVVAALPHCQLRYATGASSRNDRSMDSRNAILATKPLKAI